MMENLTVVDVLLVEDDPGDVVLIREAFEFNKVHNALHVASDGVEALDFLYRRNACRRAAPRPRPARPQPPAQGRSRGARGGQGRTRTCGRSRSSC
jgi:CheY-like chemotaxis protein